MKKYLFSLALVLSCTSAFAAADCSKNSDACAAKKLSPFEEASLRESALPHEQESIKKATAAAKASSAQAEVSTAAVPAVPVETGGRLSSPAWLFVVIAGFAALYFYLRGGLKKRRRK